MVLGFLLRVPTSAWSALLVATALKVLLFPAYRSTDHEVHRNWLAVTYNLPLSQWYTEATSPWTLDYPPLFAWFELAWARVLARVIPAGSSLLTISATEPQLDSTSLDLHRATVVVSDLVLFAGAVLVAQRSLPYRSNAFLRGVVVSLLLLMPGLLIVDHIHFQYNGMLLGVLLLSVASMMTREFITAALLFAVLLNLKHLFLALAPLYFVHLLRAYVVPREAPANPLAFLSLASVVLAVFAVTYVPFAEHLPAIAARLFPFSRGLTHAYWAPNLWALYNVADKVALAYYEVLTGHRVPRSAGVMTGGRVAVAGHVLLPGITPTVSAVLWLLMQWPSLRRVWQDPAPLRFAEHAAQCFMSYFMLGYHVHEKAILPVLVLLTLTCWRSARHASTYIGLSVIAHVSLFPLLISANETLFKYVLTLTHTYLCVLVLGYITAMRAGSSGVPRLAFSLPERVYLLGFVPLLAFTELVHPIVTAESLPFLPLLLIALYCALGNAYYFLRITLDWDHQSCVRVAAKSKQQ